MPFLLSLIITGFAYFAFEIVLPYAEAKQKEEAECAKKNGIIYESQNKYAVCINKKSIK